MKLVVFSICLNEEKTIGKVLDLIPKKIPGITSITKVVIDDGSKDNTVNVAKEHGATVLENVENKRLAHSFQTAVDYALEIGADVVVNIDGDLQFDPNEIPKLVKPIVEGKADFVAADRFTDPETGAKKRPENMPVTKYYGNLMGTKIISWLLDKNFSDVTTGFRAYNRKALLNININGQQTYTQESFQVLTAKKLNIVQVPVKVTYYKERKSRVVSSVMKYISLSTLNILRSFRDFAPLKFFSILALINFVPGILALIFLGVHWLITGSFSPYKFLGFGGAYLVTLAFIIFLAGVLADMLDRVVHNQEKILYYTKKNLFDKKK